MLTIQEATELKADIGLLIDAATEQPEPPPPPPPAPATIASFEAIPASLERGDNTVLSWDTEGADVVTLDGDTVDADGEISLSPRETTTFELVATSEGGSETRSITVEVDDPTPPPDVIGDVLEAGVHRFEELHVHSGDTLTLMPGAELVRVDVPPTDPGHGDGGIVVHGRLVAVRKEGEPPIVIRSENPTGHRGHLMLHGQAELDGVEIRDFGRTTTAYMGTSNPKARYACHWHLAGSNSAGARIENCHIHDTTEKSKWRYGIVVHGSHGVLVRSNTIHNKGGAGIYLEDGSERDNLIEGNIIRDITGTGEVRMDRRAEGPGSIGCGILAAGGWNRIIGNRIANVPHAGIGLYFSLSYRQSIRKVLEIRGNIIDGSRSGIECWNVGDRTDHVAVLEDMTVRNCSWAGYNHYPGQATVLKNWTIEDSRYGVNGGDYAMAHFSIDGGTIRRCTNGIVPSTLILKGEYRINRVEFEGNNTDIYTRTLYSGRGAANIPPRVIRAKSCLFSGKLHVWRSYWRMASSHLLQTDRLILEDYQRQGEDLEIFYDEQAPGIVVPSAIHALGIGSEEPGLTNEEHWAKYGSATAGAVAPCTTRMDAIDGLVCPLGA